ncbi:MAG: cobalamin-dependent protein [Egibacteraceae bacterium]
MTAAVPPRAVTTFLELALSGEQQAAVRLVIDLLDDGIPAGVVIRDLLGAAQRDVGRRWQAGQLSTAEEHVITGVSQAALEALSTTVGVIAPHGLVVVACAEGDWHSLPAQMFAESLRARGQGVVFLGASTPADDVATFVALRRPDALAVTCNLALYYLGTARLVDAAHRHGVPVLAGGRALTAQRAARLGADAWAPDVDGATDLLRSWRARAPVVDPTPVQLDRRAVELDAESTTLGGRAFDALEQRFPPMADYDARQRARTREDLVYIVRFVAAARLVDDAEVFTGFTAWLTALLVARGVPASALATGLATLAPLLREVDEGAYRLVLAS